MAEKHGTAIEWTHRPGTKGETWNMIRARRTIEVDGLPVVKTGWHCEHVHEGCRVCYAEAMNRWRGTGLDYKPGNRAEVEIFLDEKRLLQPLHWTAPRTIFPCSMTDLFGAWVTDAMLDRIFAVMALTPQHTYIVLTKRPERQRDYLGQDRALEILEAAESLVGHDGIRRRRGALRLDNDAGYELARPLPNVEGGVSVSTQADAEAFLPALRDTPLARRIVSYEPALGPVDFRPWLSWLDQVVFGGESDTDGKSARPPHPDWPRHVRDHCAAADVAFFFKQWGAHAPAWERAEVALAPALLRMRRVGKARAGRLLDGVEHNGFPGAPS